MVKRKAYVVILLVLFLTKFSANAQEQDPINILFIGNSFTIRHDFNLLVEELVKEGKPNLNIYTERAVYGGQSLFQHTEYYFTQTFIEQSTIENVEIERRIAKMESLLAVTDPPLEFIHFWKDIREQKVDEFPKSYIQTAIKRHKDLLSNNLRKKWDYVVMQTWQDEYPDLNDGYAKYAKYLGAIAHQQGAKVIFYMTAPNFQNEKPVAGPVKQAEYEKKLNVILRLAQEIQPFAVIPVPMAINMIQQGGTELTFRYVNDFHPNQCTAFLTANMFYAAFFNESTEGFKFNTVTETNPKGMGTGRDPDGNPAKIVFKEDDKIYLQQKAYNAVNKFNQLWKGKE